MLLKAVFDHLRVNDYRYAYFTAFPRYVRLIDFARDFGFYPAGTVDEEYIMAKELVPSEQDVPALSPFELHKKFGPNVFSFSGNTTFIVPIKSNYHAMLFPELEAQEPLFSYPCGNSIKKAYLSRSRTNKPTQGDVLPFYRTHDLRAVTAVGVVEAILRSNLANVIAGSVGTRTVFSYNQIQDMSQDRVLAINFRLARVLAQPIPCWTLELNGLISRAPQSIAAVSDTTWLTGHLRM